jgi:hypothetical protein
MGWVVKDTPWPLYPRETDPVPILQEARWAPGPVWTGAENLATHRDSIAGPLSPYRLPRKLHYCSGVKCLGRGCYGDYWQRRVLEQSSEENSGGKEVRSDGG